MTTMRIGSTWLENPSDEQMVEKAAKGMGTIITQSSLVQRLAKAAETVVVCRAGHENTVAKIESLKKCKCGAPWAVVKGEKLEEDETEAVTVRTVKSDQIPTGGLTDGVPTMTSKNRIRRPFTGSR